MQIDFGKYDDAGEILEKVYALLAYHEALLCDYRGGGSRVDRRDRFGAAVFSELLQAMVQAAIDKLAPQPALKAVNEA